MLARGETHTGWWPLVAFRGVMACSLPWELRDLFELWSPVSRGVSLGARGPRDGPDVVPLHCCTDAEGRALVPAPVKPVHFIPAPGPHMRHEPGGHVVPLAGVVHGGGAGVRCCPMAEGEICHGAGSILEVARSKQPSDADSQNKPLPCGDPDDPQVQVLGRRLFRVGVGAGGVAFRARVGQMPLLRGWGGPPRCWCPSSYAFRSLGRCAEVVRRGSGPLPCLQSRARQPKRR